MPHQGGVNQKLERMIVAILFTIFDDAQIFEIFLKDH